jgi:CPA1 family monovalent cation:H+ antiporter
MTVCANFPCRKRETFIAARDGGRIDDEVLRSVLRGLDLEEATLNRD